MSGTGTGGDGRGVSAAPFFKPCLRREERFSHAGQKDVQAIPGGPHQPRTFLKRAGALHVGGCVHVASPAFLAEDFLRKGAFDSVHIVAKGQLLPRNPARQAVIRAYRHLAPLLRFLQDAHGRAAEEGAWRRCVLFRASAEHRGGCADHGPALAMERSMQRFFAAGKAVHAILQQVGASQRADRQADRAAVIPCAGAPDPAKAVLEIKGRRAEKLRPGQDPTSARRQTVACEAVRIVPPQTQAAVSRV